MPVELFALLAELRGAATTGLGRGRTDRLEACLELIARELGLRLRVEVGGAGLLLGDLAHAEHATHGEPVALHAVTLGCEARSAASASQATDAGTRSSIDWRRKVLIGSLSAMARSIVGLAPAL